MHTKELRAAGESEQRLYLLDAWEESPFYSERERAARGLSFLDAQWFTSTASVYPPVPFGFSGWFLLIRGHGDRAVQICAREPPLSGSPI
jgi:hypothetical protein